MRKSLCAVTKNKRLNKTVLKEIEKRKYNSTRKSSIKEIK